MKRIVAVLLLPAAFGLGFGQSDDSDLYQLARTDLSAFGKAVTGQARNDYQRAKAVVSWLARNFDWTATDYKTRTVSQIIDRKGGNCAELARVTTSVLETLELPMRRVREINLHKRSERRQKSAEARIRERGLSMSVFGRQHNDHVWIEIYDRVSGEWFPADPSLGVVGVQEWLQSRLGFGERFSLDPSSKDMIAPFAVFAYDGDRRIDRTTHYLIEGFDDLYENKLRKLPDWPDWKRLLGALNDKALGAFRGETNLHDFGKEIQELSEVYANLKAQYLAESH